MAEENKVGRPLKFKSAKELQAKIEEYFTSCFEEWWVQVKDGEGYTWQARTDRHGNIMMRQVRPFTISGLAVHLGTSRQTLLNYAEKDDFFDTITRAKARIENYTEEQLFNTEARNIAGIQFNLKNNYTKWSDKQELEHSGEMNFVINRKRMNHDAAGDD